MPTIENDILRVSFSLHGGELTSVFLKDSKTELLYDGKGSWNCQDHILFPIIGPKKAYTVDGKTCAFTTQHGFPRNSEFELLDHSGSEATIRLASNEENLKEFPHRFELLATYSLVENRLIRKYKIINVEDSVLPCNLGSHAAYVAHFGKATLDLGEKEVRYFPRPDFLVSDKDEAFPHKSVYLLNKKEFEKYETIIIKTPKTPLILDNGDGIKTLFHYASPYIAIWSPVKEPSDFVCVEPWWGLPIYKDEPIELANRKDELLIEKEAEYSEEVEFLKE